MTKPCRAKKAFANTALNPISRLVSAQDTRSLPAHLAIAVGVVAASLLVRLALDPLLRVGTQFSAFYIGVAVAAYAGGTRAAVFAAILSALAADYWFLGQTRHLDFTISTSVAQLLFLLVCSAFITTVHVLRRTQRNLQSEAGELDKQRHWFQVTFSSIGDGVITTDTRGHVTFINPAAEAMTGWAQGDASGRPLETVFNIVNEDTRLPAPNPIAEVLQTGKIVQLANHTTLMARNGREIPIEDSAAPIRDSAGQVVGAVMVFHDVTGRRKTVDALRQAESRKTAILEASLDAIVTMDHEGRIADFNRSAEQIFGYRNDQAIGQELSTLIIPERYRERHRQGLARYLATGKGRVFDQRLELSALRSDGHEFPAELSISIIAGLSPPMFTATLRDITARKQGEDALRESEERFRAAFEQAAVGIAIANLDGRLVEMNAKAAEVFGYSPAELQQHTFLDVTHPDDIAPTRENVRRLLAGEMRSYAMEKRYVRKDRSIVWSLTTVTLLKSADGAPNKMIGILEDITRRKHAEEALRRREEELRAMADSIPQLAWMAEPAGHIFWYNRGWFDYTGTTLDQMQGWGWQSVHDPEILPSVIERWRESIESGKPFDMEFPLRGADGVFRWFLTRVNPLFDGEGRVVRWFGTNTNVDDVRRAREALQEETRILELLNHTGTAIAAKLDLQALVQTVTDASTELSGAKFGAFFYNVVDQNGETFLLYTLSGAPREAFERFGMPRNTAVFHPTFHNSGIVRSGDITKDPRYGKMAPHHGMPMGHLPVRSYLAVPVVSRNGDVIGGLFFGHPEPNVFTERAERLIAGVAAQAAIAIDNARLYEGAQREINERRRAEAGLRESEARLRVSLDASALGTWEYDPKESRFLLDARCQELFGIPGRDQIDLKAFFERAHPEDRARRERLFREALQPTGPRRYEIEYRTAGFPLRWLRTSGRVFFDEAGAPVKFITAVFDITDVVRARETLAERRRELEELVAARTESLQQAVAQMEEFSYSVSHDLRTPLRAIHGYAEVLENDYGDRLDAVGRSYLQRIANAAQRMDRLTLDVLTYSKIGQDAMQLAPVSLEKVVSETIEQYVTSLDVPHRIDVARPLPDVVAHEPLLVQAISNLVTNALKFVRAGEIPEIKIRAEPREEDVRLWVEDRGIGLPQESQVRIWGMFERIHPKDLYDGTGIGLAIVRKSIERMNGSVGVESDGTTGSKFWIQLPGASGGRKT